MNQMLSLKQRLLSLDRDIRVAVIGTGSMGSRLACQISQTPGMKPVALADIDIKKAIACAQLLKLDFEIADTLTDLNFAIQRGKTVVTENAELICKSNLVHVTVESSNSVYGGALHALKAIRNYQHVVMMNAEADLMYGPILLQAAQEEGVVYTGADGDKPNVIKKLADEIEMAGLTLVMAGNIKNFQDRYTSPDKIGYEAEVRALAPKMCSYFADGSKLNVEMSQLANAINGRALQPGMMGKSAASVYDVFKLYDFDQLWNRHTPLVDYLIGAEPRGGVFVIGHTEDKHLQQSLNWYPADIGAGPYYLFYRPYYLGAVEAMPCIAEAYLDNSARLQPAHGMKTNVFAYAKQDIKQGQTLDGHGGHRCYGMIENMDDQTQSLGLPLLISENLKAKRDIRKDERISLADVEIPAHDPRFNLYFESAGIRGATPGRPERVIEPVFQFV